MTDENRIAARRRTAILAGISGGLAVLIGAFGAHGLEDYLTTMGVDSGTIPKRLDQFDVGARYHLAHAVALLAMLGASDLVSPRIYRWVCRLLMAGMLLFSGSLYVLVATNTSWLGAITPLGGTAWILAWGLFAVGAMKQR